MAAPSTGALPPPRFEAAAVQPAGKVAAVSPLGLLMKATSRFPACVAAPKVAVAVAAATAALASWTLPLMAVATVVTTLTLVHAGALAQGGPPAGL